MRRCQRPGCPGLVADGRCYVCGAPSGRRSDRRSAAARGYGWWWSNPNGTGLRDRFLAANPLCMECDRQGRVEPAVDVDHIVPHRGDPKLLRHWDNLQSLCHRHHSLKTARGQ